MNLTTISIGLETCIAYSIAPQLRKIHSTRPEFREPGTLFLANAFASVLQFSSGLTLGQLAVKSVPSLIRIGNIVTLTSLGAMTFLFAGTLLGAFSKPNGLKYSLLLQRINQATTLAFSLIIAASGSPLFGAACAISVLYGYHRENRKQYKNLNAIMTATIGITSLGLFLAGNELAGWMTLSATTAGFLHYKAVSIIL